MSLELTLKGALMRQVVEQEVKTRGEKMSVAKTKAKASLGPHGGEKVAFSVEVNSKFSSNLLRRHAG